MNAVLTEIKDALQGVLELIDSNPGDTTPERWADNRRRLKRYMIGMDRLKALGTAYPVLAPKVDEFVTVFKDYFNYFNPAYKATHTIDELPDKLRGMLEAGIKKINEAG